MEPCHRNPNTLERTRHFAKPDRVTLGSMHLGTQLLESMDPCKCHERSFAPSFLSFLESDFALLWYKTLQIEVAWTEENAGKSEFKFKFKLFTKLGK